MTHLFIYSDASVRVLEKQQGFGVVILDKHSNLVFTAKGPIPYALNPAYDSNLAEALALHAAVKIAAAYTANMVFHTDNMNLVEVHKHPSASSKPFSTLIRALPQLTLQHLPRHHAGMKQADYWSRAARDAQDLGLLTDFNPAIQATLKKPKSRISNLPKILRKPWLEYMFTNRRCRMSA